MTRRCVVDVETTGLKAGKPDRIVEIACVELDGTRLTGNEYQTYVSPRVKVDPGAFKVHGLSDAFLSDKPEFEDVASDFLSFIGDDELVIHNKDFDVGFLNYELKNAGLQELKNRVFCTLKFARQQRPGRRNTLDALVAEYKIKSQRVDGIHGALPDCRDLGKVYAAMIQAQGTVQIDFDAAREERPMPQLSPGDLIVTYATPAEIAAHAQMCSKLGIKVWQQHPQK